MRTKLATTAPPGRRVSAAELLQLCGYAVTVLELPNGSQLIRIDGAASPPSSERRAFDGQSSSAGAKPQQNPSLAAG